MTTRDGQPLREMAGALAAAMARDVAIVGTTPVGGGCINRAARLETTIGPFFAKWHSSPPPGMFSAEAAGLIALRSAASALVVPEPVAWRDGGGETCGFLVTTWLERGHPGPAFDERLGAGLAALHEATAPAYGFDIDGFCGSTPQPNGWMERWVDFYRLRRIEHQVRLARDAGRLGSAEARDLDRVAARLDRLLPVDGERPALVHGDLWSGNSWVGADGAPGLVDPAAYYGHREAELGMMTLFGGFGRRVFDAYEAARPLPEGWRERNGLYQLYHLLNHLNLFGGAYGGQALSVARRYL